MIEFGEETEGEPTIVLTKGQAREVCAAVDRGDDEIEIALSPPQRGAVRGTDFGFDFTGGQRDLIQAALDVGIQSFQIRSTDALTVITMKTEPRTGDGNTLIVTGEWWGAGRFKASYVEEHSRTDSISSRRAKSQSLSATIERLNEWAKKRAKKTA